MFEINVFITAKGEARAVEILDPSGKITAMPGLDAAAAHLLGEGHEVCRLRLHHDEGGFAPAGYTH